MACQIIKVNPKKPQKKIIQMAAEIIKKGGLVAFPTETVYGLGANGLDKKAIKKIFKAKRRPQDNPLILHIADLKDLFKLAKKVPKEAQTLVQKFWPGPLTIVLFKRKSIPNEVSANRDTVAIRMPRNKIAQELIKASGVPIAAPSANLAGRPSPTSAKDVFEDLGREIDLILDGGKTKIGIESTVVDLTVKPPLILRPGAISIEELKKFLPNIKLHPFLIGKKLKEKTPKSPGMKYKHYAPEAPLILIQGNLKEKIEKFQNLISFYKKQKKRIGIMVSKETKKFLKNGKVNLILGTQKNLKEIARNLFNALRQFDRKKIDIILCESFPEKEIGFAIMYRLKKAASKIV